MLDLDYSDSDASDTEQKPAPARSTAPAPAPAPAPPKKPLTGLAALLPKPKSRKQKDAEGTADDSAPRKIIVNLPKFEGHEEDRPAKKARIGGSGGSGLSAMLPAPKKRTTVPPPPPPPTIEEEELPILPPVSAPEVKKGAATSSANTAFVPQSVARKPIQPMSAFRKKAPAAGKGKAKAQPQVSLFGAGKAWLQDSVEEGADGVGSHCGSECAVTAHETGSCGTVQTDHARGGATSTETE